MVTFLTILWFFVCSLLWFRDAENLCEEYDESTKTPSDYSVEVHNLPDQVGEGEFL
jgi:ATP/ADP translocase